MVIAKNVFKEDAKYVEIPAYMENGVLILGHNGSSSDYNFIDISKYNVEDFVYFTDHLYRGCLKATPQFLYKNEIPFELVRVFCGGKNSRKKLYTHLSPCTGETYFCKCDDCGSRYVIDNDEVMFYKSNNLALPTVRCKECIKRRRNK